jgi:CubicO group peptidase (beta-lactamase class C family)
MKKILIVALVMTIVSASIAQDSFIKFQKKEALKTSDYQEYMDAMNKLIDFSGAIQVYHKGNIEFDYSKGVEKDGEKKEISSSSKFAIASLSKAFTAMEILKLEEAGRIDLKKTVSDYLTYYPKELGSKIKIEDLLNNRSGLPDYTARYDEVNSSNLSVKDFILKFCTDQLEFEPGTRYAYSNTGFYLLGGIIESITGKSYKEAIEEDILKATNMSNSGVFERKKQVDIALVDGHEKMVKTKPFNAITGFSAGGVYSTTDDLIKWYQAIHNHKLLPESTVNEMFSGKPIPYYKGWSYKPVLDKLAFGHSGGMTGFNSHILTVPSEDLFIVVLANNTLLPLRDLAHGLAAIALGKEVDLPQLKGDIIVPPMLLNKFVGTYKNAASGNSMQIGVENDKLFLLLFGSKIILKTESITKFYIDQFGPALEFDFNGNMTWFQEGNAFEYMRVSDDAPQPTSTEISLSENEIKRLLGEYKENGMNSSIKITWKAKQLIFQKDDGEEYTLIQKKDLFFYYPVQENGYSFKYPVEFKLENGNVNRLVFDGNITYEKK